MSQTISGEYGSSHKQNLFLVLGDRGTSQFILDELIGTSLEGLDASL